MDIRVADIQARCCIRDPDGYIIEVGQNKPDFTYGSRQDA
jgi:hypothetical protein